MPWRSLVFFFFSFFVSFGWAAPHPAVDGKQCLDCHKLNAELWEKSIHAESGFTCLTCHDLGNVKNPKLLAEKEVKLICYQCHDNIKPSFQKGAHNKGGVQCSDCHSPHGSRSEKLLKKEKTNEICQACHDKEPHHFISNKVSVKMEKLKCLNCHGPHSNRAKYLKFKKEDLCVRCHKEVY